jgi:hypothetical protein
MMGMRYSEVYIKSFGYELALNVVTSDDLESVWSRFMKLSVFRGGNWKL